MKIFRLKYFIEVIKVHFFSTMNNFHTHTKKKIVIEKDYLQKNVTNDYTKTTDLHKLMETSPKQDSYQRSL